MSIRAVRKAEAVLLCGWRRDLADMIKELDAAAPPNSEIWLLNTGTPVLAFPIQKYLLRRRLRIVIHGSSMQVHLYLLYWYKSTGFTGTKVLAAAGMAFASD